MTDKPIKVKSHAERLASFLEQMEQMFPNPQAAAELRRLHEVNQVLVEALGEIIALDRTEENEWDAVEQVIPNIIKIAQAALAKAKEST